MGSRFRKIIAALAVLSAFGAAAASGASAVEFVVEGKPLSGPETVSGVGSAAKITVQFGGATIKIECSKSTATGTITPPATFNSVISFKECAVTSPSGCKLARASAEQIDFNGAGGMTSTSLIEQKGVGANEIVTEFDVEGCFPEYFTFVGHWNCELFHHTEALEWQEVGCRKTESFLKMGEFTASASYVETFKLASGKPWRVQ